MEYFTKQLQQMAKQVYELDKVYEMEEMQLRFETLLTDKPLWTLRREQTTTWEWQNVNSSHIWTNLANRGVVGYTNFVKGGESKEIEKVE